MVPERSQAIRGPLECPLCGLINPGTTRRCDCGYDFQAGTGPPPYIRFWLGVSAFLLDTSPWLPPLAGVCFWSSPEYRYYAIPALIAFAMYGFLFHRDTPGKLFMRVRIRELNGEPVSYRHVFLKYCLGFSISLVMSVSLLYDFLSR